MSAGRQRIVRFELNHWPNNDAHSIEGFFQWMKLREQSSFDPCSGFVTWPQFIAKRLDDVIGRHADMRSSVLKHLDDHGEDARDGAERRISFVKATETVELAKQFIGSVDEMDDHAKELAADERR